MRTNAEVAAKKLTDESAKTAAKEAAKVFLDKVELQTDETKQEFKDMMKAVDDVIKTASVQPEGGEQLTAKTDLFASPYLELLVKGFGITAKDLEPLKDPDGKYTYDNIDKINEKNDVTKNKIRKAVLMLSLELGVMRQEMVSRLKDSCPFVGEVAADPEKLLQFGTCLLGDYNYRFNLMREVKMSLARGMDQMFTAHKDVYPSRTDKRVSYAYSMYKETLDIMLSQAEGAAKAAAIASARSYEEANLKPIKTIMEKVEAEDKKPAKERNYEVYLKALTDLGYTPYSQAVMMRTVASSRCLADDQGVNEWAHYVIQEMKKYVPLLEDLVHVREEQVPAVEPMETHPFGQPQSTPAAPTAPGQTADVRQVKVAVDLAPTRSSYLSCTHDAGSDSHKDVGRARTLIASQFRSMKVDTSDTHPDGKALAIEFDIPAVVTGILRYIHSLGAGNRTAAEDNLRKMFTDKKTNLAVKSIDGPDGGYTAVIRDPMKPEKRESLEDLAQCIRNKQQLATLCRGILQAQFEHSMAVVNDLLIKLDNSPKEDKIADEIVRRSDMAIKLDAVRTLMMRVVSDDLRQEILEKSDAITKLPIWVSVDKVEKAYDDAKARLDAEEYEIMETDDNEPPVTVNTSTSETVTVTSSEPAATDAGSSTVTTAAGSSAPVTTMADSTGTVASSVNTSTVVTPASITPVILTSTLSTDALTRTPLGTTSSSSATLPTSTAAPITTAPTLPLIPAFPVSSASFELPATQFNVAGLQSSSSTVASSVASTQVAAFIPLVQCYGFSSQQNDIRRMRENFLRTVEALSKASTSSVSEQLQQVAGDLNNVPVPMDISVNVSNSPGSAALADATPITLPVILGPTASQKRSSTESAQEPVDGSPRDRPVKRRRSSSDKSNEAGTAPKQQKLAEPSVRVQADVDMSENDKSDARALMALTFTQEESSAESYRLEQEETLRLHLEQEAEQERLADLAKNKSRKSQSPLNGAELRRSSRKRTSPKRFHFIK
ncbi:hypothetical protein M3P05_17130 [Sansalvadorimonas sp. 2012CJ34-2]|uniref:Uncharacterized protein n=1 Tax=Parendozoicomonas callyspongiae TaxID=2942213 RepID=A0ABT0PJY2_9GAMM|nr:hypothetical protein [Sansalvadorimonas sp. 2012CJ34-2]MCL6271643.1 hypothetical protein [Sansalvadorimonas sp. 2012CJ34-2]